MAGLIAFLIGSLPLIIGFILVSLGITYVVFEGLSLFLTEIEDQIRGIMQNIPADALAIMLMMSIDKFISIIMSAYLLKLVLNGLQNNRLTKIFYSK